MCVWSTGLGEPARAQLVGAFYLCRAWALVWWGWTVKTASLPSHYRTVARSCQEVSPTYTGQANCIVPFYWKWMQLNKLYQQLPLSLKDTSMPREHCKSYAHRKAWLILWIMSSYLLLQDWSIYLKVPTSMVYGEWVYGIFFYLYDVYVSLFSVSTCIALDGFKC